MADVIYGYQTVFPIPLGLGSTWNPDLIREDYRYVAEEASSDGDMVTFSPPVDLVRDARWGRCLEMPGEDPVLTSHFAKAMVEGLQNTHENGKSVASCMKHFAGYGAVEAGREYNTVDMSKRRFLQDYMLGYKAAVDAGCEMVMTSFNTIDEIPATANKWLMDDLLRKEWGFDGVIITDYAAVSELKAHGVTADDYEAARLAMNATVDIDMKTSCYANQLAILVEDGQNAQFATGRPAKTSTHSGRFVSRYLDCPNEALYPFGYGLSYHTAKYNDLTLDRTTMSTTANDSIQVSVTVTNTSDVSGTETVQLYIRDLVGSVVRPVLELKDYRQIALAAQETKTVTFTITEEVLHFYTKDYAFTSEPGDFKVFVGPNSVDLAEADFHLTE